MGHTINVKRSKTEIEILKKAGQVYIKAQPETWNVQLATVEDKAGALLGVRFPGYLRT